MTRRPVPAGWRGTRPPYALLAVGVLVAGSVFAGNMTVPSRASGIPGAVATDRREPVVGALAVCPELLKAGGDVTTQLTLGTAVPGQVNVRAASVVPGGARGPEVLARGGAVDSFGVPGDQALAVAATATGPLSGALEVEQVSRGVDGLQRGLAGVRCESTAQETWFLGGATTVGIETELVLVNPYDDAALVDVELYGVRGRIEAPGAEGVVIGARRRVVLPLARYAPDERGLAVHVIAREGRIAPAIRDARVAVDVPRGVDWIPRAGRPATVVHVPGVPGGNGRRLLYLFAPGEDTAEVEVQATFEDGQIVPAGFEELQLRPNTVAVLDMTEALDTKPAALRLEAQGAPVIANVLAENRARYNPIQEFAYVGPAGPLAGPALVTDARVRLDVVDSHLLLSSPDGPSRVEVKLMPVARRPNRLPPPRVVTVPAGRLVVVKLSAREYAVPGPYAQRPVVVTPLEGSTAVYASRVLTEVGLRGPLFTVLPLVSQPTGGVPVPEVVADPRVSLVDPRREDQP